MGHTLVIAECGSCHDNDIDKAYALIDAATSCGANCCKFQYWSDAQKLYDQRKLTDPKYLEFYKHYQMPREWLGLLKHRCYNNGMEFMSTVYLPEDCATLAPYQDRVKIANYEMDQEALIFHARDTFRDVIVSVRSDRWATSRFSNDVFQLYCVPNYPTAIEGLKLPHFSCDEGLSDHTTSLITGALAVARGATIVEKHIRIEETDDRNPDYEHSMIADNGNEVRPADFCTYVDNIREAEEALG